MASSANPRFTIVGAGLGGALMACHLGKAGYAVDLYEKRPDPRLSGAERGRSINLALSLRGIEALRQVGLADEVLRAAIPMRGRMIHSPTAKLAFQPYGKDENEILRSVSRAGLNLILIEAAARYPNLRMFFEKRCTGIDLRTNAIELELGPPIRCDMVIAADGVYSAIRAQMQKQDRFDYHQEYLSHGYKELTIPAGPGSAFFMERHALHIWPRRSFMMIALPNLDGSFTCTLFAAYEGADSFAALKTEADVRRFFEQQFPDAVPLMPSLVEDFFANPTGPLLTIRCSPWHLDGRVALLGDAAHAVVPFLGQGMNAAFEDCTILSRRLDEHAPDWGTAFAEFEGQRKIHVDALADLCVDNFIEMRDRVASPLFRLRKRMQVLLHKLFPRWYLSLYTLIEFTTVPYADAVRRTRRQDWIVRGAGIALLAAMLIVVWWLLVA